MTTTVLEAPVGAPVPAASRGRVPRARRRRRGRAVSSTIAVLFCLVWGFPVYWMLNSAFKPASELETPTPVFLPLPPSLDSFANALVQSGFAQDLVNSLIVVAGTIVLSIALGILAAAAVTRFRFRGRRAVLIAILAVQMLPPTALLIPTFLVFNSLDLVGSYLGLILAYVASVLPFSIWVMRGFFLSVPVELEEAAAIDGATRWQGLVRVVFPLVAPGVIATSIFAFISAWNDYLLAYTFMKDQSMYTLPVWLASFARPGHGIDFGAQMAGSTIFALPVVVFFLIVQRNLVAGMSAGAVKG